MPLNVPLAAIDAAEEVWNRRLSAGIITPPREHIEALLEAAAPYMVLVKGEVVPPPINELEQLEQPSGE